MVDRWWPSFSAFLVPGRPGNYNLISLYSQHEEVVLNFRRGLNFSLFQNFFFISNTWSQKAPMIQETITMTFPRSSYWSPLYHHLFCLLFITITEDQTQATYEEKEDHWAHSFWGSKSKQHNAGSLMRDALWLYHHVIDSNDGDGGTGAGQGLHLKPGADKMQGVRLAPF